MMLRNPRGKGSIFTAIITAVVLVVLAPVTLAIGPLLGPILSEVVYGAAVAGGECVAGLYGCGGGGGGGGGQQVQVGASCSSAPNACNQTNLGTVVNNGNDTGSCSATPPPNSNCPAPTIQTGNAGNGFYATPSTLGPGGSATLTWDAANATDCVIKSDNGFSSNSLSYHGSLSVGPVSQTTTYTLTCEDGSGGTQGSAVLKILIDPHYKEL
jgi:hypothetical protein